MAPAKFGRTAALTLALGMLASLPVAAHAGPAWATLTADEQSVLRPLQNRWDTLSDTQRARLIGAAKRYPGLPPAQQRRFSQRLNRWASLSLEQREQARAAYRAYSRMSKQKQARIRKDWFDRHPESRLATATPAVESAAEPTEDADVAEPSLAGRALPLPP